MSFDFFKTITDYIDPVIDFIAGEKVMTSDMAKRGEAPERKGGFLDFVRGGAEAYVAMTDKDDDKEAFEPVEYKEPRITRFTGRAPASPGATPGVRPLGAADARVQKLYNNLRTRQYANADMNRIGQNFRVGMTTRSGRRTVALESAKSPQVKEAAPAAVRKHPQEVV